MAFDADQISAQLYIFSFGRKQKRKDSYVYQYNDCFSDQRALAWSKLDFCDLGPVSWTGTGFESDFCSKLGKMSSGIPMAVHVCLCKCNVAAFSGRECKAGDYALKANVKNGVIYNQQRIVR